MAVHEDVAVLPESWWRESHPRRGGRYVPDFVVDAEAGAAVRAVIRERRGQIEAVLEHPETDAELAGRVRAYLDGRPDATGAAGVAAIVRWRWWVQESSGFLDAWLGEHGVGFAVGAALEHGRMEIVEPPANPNGTVVLVAYAGGPPPPSQIGIRYGYPSRELDVASRLRALLAQAGDADYAEAVERLAGYRRTPSERLLVSYLVPGEREWVDECCRQDRGSGSVERLICSLGTAEQARAIGAGLGWVRWSPGLIATLVEGVGVEAAAGALARSLEQRPYQEEILLEALAALPSDVAFQALVDRGAVRELREALRRFPVRGARLLAPLAGTSDVAEGLLVECLLGDPGVVDRLPEEAREALVPLLASIARIERAEELPGVLAEPPWTRRRARPKAFVLEGLAEPEKSLVLWEPGERERWRQSDHRYTYYWTAGRGGDWEKAVLRARGEGMSGAHKVALFATAPEEVVRPLLGAPEKWSGAGAGEWLPTLVSRFELEVLPLALRLADAAPAAVGNVLLPFLDAEVAWMMADWLGRLKVAGAVAQRWFGRHGLAAVPMLLPAALDRPGDDRRAAEGALRLLAGAHGAEAVVSLARVHGEEAARAIEEMLGTDPLELLPGRPPKIAAWADPASLPPIHLRGCERILPDAATGHVLAMLAMSKPHAVYAGLDVVREVCDPRSLARFGWAVFQRWQLAGAPSKDNWALHQLGWLGDDDTVRRLAPLIRAWPGEKLSARAATGLDVLGSIGSDVALLHLHEISRRMKYKSLRARALEKIEEVAAALGLSAEQLADRAVPDFGLDAAGSLTLDYGARRFTVGFDEQLRPFAVGADGARRTSLPKPAASDDAVAAAEARARFAALRKEVKAIAEGQIRRLEQAMVTDRRWSVAEFRRYLVEHPLMWHIVRRLVWLADDIAFRVAEDGSFADVDDGAFAPGDAARIGVAHPLRLGDDLATWTEVFADYEILQPFPQLGRPVFVLTPDERRSGELARFEGAIAPYGRAKGLSQGRWSAGEGDCLARRAGDHHVVVELSPGLTYGRRGEFGDQTVTAVRLAVQPRRARSRGDAALRFGDLDPAVASEIVHDLTRLTEGPR
ncbi:DUF4132 domain-containing protein [Spirillospora sp. CA-294931]|uniref:DUF4132 domain-containing protein n=1 Tax=Spirillospora sp. CA-294931 TaxID=3240042 RepID=UPI003D8C60DD